MKRKEIIKYLILRTVGNFLVLFTLFGFVFTFGPTIYYEINFKIDQAKGVKYTVPDEQQVSELGKLMARQKAQGTANNPQESLLAKIDTKPNEKMLVPKSTDFSIIIPKLGINERVFANIDATDPNIFLPILQKGVAHAKGTAFPGMNGITYIFAHSTDNFWNVGRYNAVFYLLKELQPGDDIVIFFQNKRYSYKVFAQKIVDDSDTSFLKSNIGQGELLILQTCWPPGTTWKRLLIFATPK